MNPQYRHIVNGVQVNPKFKDDLAKEYTTEQSQVFKRVGLSGRITLTGADFDLVNGSDFSTIFYYTIDMKKADGTWDEGYFRGKFMKTDCKFNYDDKAVEIKVSGVDNYSGIISGVEKEFNITDMNPPMTPLNVFKRGIIQIYVLGNNSITCIVGGNSWEQPCKVITNGNDLVNKYYFSLQESDFGSVEIKGGSTPSCVGRYDTQDGKTWTGASGNAVGWEIRTTESGGTYTRTIYRKSDNKAFYQSVTKHAVWNYSLVFVVVGGSGGYIPFQLWSNPLGRAYGVYARYLLGRDGIPGVVDASGNPTYIDNYPVPDDDILDDKNPNYPWCMGYGTSRQILYLNADNATQVAPTEWGLAPNGRYYRYPDWLGIVKYFPIARNTWGALSIWYEPPLGYYYNSDMQLAAPFSLRDCYKVSDVIKSLLSKIAPDISHEATTEYSQFLYGTTDVKKYYSTLVMTQKTNLLQSYYDRAAVKTPITLKTIFDMLRNCYKLYWFIDNGKLRIEHISWFMNGGSYDGTPEVGIDLTTMINPQNGKPWSYGKNMIEYDKSDISARLQFGYMDDVSLDFAGQPIDAISNYAQEGKIEEINISNFTPDVDFMLGYPTEFSKDGYVLFEAVNRNILINLLKSSYPSTAWHVAGYYDANGVRQTGSGYRTVGDPIPCVPAQTYRLVSRSNVLINGVWWHFFNAKMQNIGRAETTGGVITVPDNAYYIALTMKISSSASPSSTLPVTDPASVGGILEQSLSTDIENGDISSQHESHMQNYFLSWKYLLPNYYMHDMPVAQVSVNGAPTRATGVKRLKKQQVKFPAATDPDSVLFIKTDLGYGQIEKLSINLSSRLCDATLKYPTDDSYQQ